MHPSAYTQRQNAAYSRLEAAEEFLATNMAWPDDTPRLSAVTHPDANLRALLKLEAAADLVVRVAQDSGYKEKAAEPFAPSEYIVPPELAAAAAPAPEPAEPPEPAPKRVSSATARKNAAKGAAKTASKTPRRR